MSALATNPAPGVKFVLGIAKQAGKRLSQVQSVIFDKLQWTADAAKAWLNEQGFSGLGAESGATYWRFRQKSPAKFKEYATIAPGKRNPSLKYFLLYGYTKSKRGTSSPDWNERGNFASTKEAIEWAKQETDAHGGVAYLYRDTRKIAVVKADKRVRTNPSHASTVPVFRVGHSGPSHDLSRHAGTVVSRAGLFHSLDAALQLAQRLRDEGSSLAGVISGFYDGVRSYVVVLDAYGTAQQLRAERVPVEAAVNPTTGELIDAYREHLGMTEDPEFQDALPDEQAAAMTAVDAVENPRGEGLPSWERAISYRDWFAYGQRAGKSPRWASVEEALASRMRGDVLGAPSDYLNTARWYFEEGFKYARTGELPGYLREFADRGRENPYDEEGRWYLTPERRAESERSFGSQFFTASRGFGTTIQSARARVKKWSAEVAAGDERNARNLSMYLNAIAHYEELRKTGRRVKRNPEDAAASLAETFHGREPDTITEFVDEEHEHEWYAGLGDLVELKVRTVSGLTATIQFPEGEGRPQLSSSEDGRQLYIIGGDTEIDLKALKMDGKKWSRDSMVLGTLVEATYHSAKGFDRFRPTDYYHRFAEDGGSTQPTLIYDSVNKRLSVAGGNYQVTARGVEN